MLGEMVTVGDLLEFLEKNKVRKDTLICINGDLVRGMEVVLGRVQDGYYNKQFHISPKGKEVAIRFTHAAELSTGEVILDSPV